jgi:hypothetical protein
MAGVKSKPSVAPRRWQIVTWSEIMVLSAVGICRRMMMSETPAL